MKKLKNRLFFSQAKYKKEEKKVEEDRRSIIKVLLNLNLFVCENIASWELKLGLLLL